MTIWHELSQWIIDEQWMPEKPGLQAFTHWFIIDEQWMAEKPGLQAFTHWFIIDEQMSNGL